MSIPIYPFLLSPLVTIRLFYTSVTPFLFVNKFICTIFLDSTYMRYHICLSLSDLLHSEFFASIDKVLMPESKKSHPPLPLTSMM